MKRTAEQICEDSRRYSSTAQVNFPNLHWTCDTSSQSFMLCSAPPPRKKTFLLKLKQQIWAAISAITFQTPICTTLTLRQCRQRRASREMGAGIPERYRDLDLRVKKKEHGRGGGGRKTFSHHHHHHQARVLPYSSRHHAATSFTHTAALSLPLWRWTASWSDTGSGRCVSVRDCVALWYFLPQL